MSTEDAAPDKETAGKPRVGDGTPGPGRPKGSQNRATKAVKDTILAAAEELGGADRLVEWAKEDPKNEAAFWSSIYPKLLPKELTGPEGGNLFPAGVTVRLVKPES